MAYQGMVSKACEHVGGATYSHLKQQTCNVADVQSTRTKEKLQMKSVCLEDLWSDGLSLLGWSSWAAASGQYSRCVNRLQDFCICQGVSFPPDHNATRIIADFLCDIADCSLRPESQVKVSVAAIAALYESLGLTNPCLSGRFQGW